MLFLVAIVAVGGFGGIGEGVLILAVLVKGVGVGSGDGLLLVGRGGWRFLGLRIVVAH